MPGGKQAQHTRYSCVKTSLWNIAPCTICMYNEKINKHKENKMNVESECTLRRNKVGNLHLVDIELNLNINQGSVEEELQEGKLAMQT